jgi:AraC-like DNA-binding protein
VSEHSSSMHRVETTENYGSIHLDVKRYIEAHSSESIVLRDFISQSGYSQRQVQRALSWHDTNWQRMLLDERMNRARQLLANTRDPINRVSEMAGYNSPSQFSRTFKAEEGMTPEEYRQYMQAQRR